MLLTAPLLSKSSIFVSLLNKCRQVVKIKPTDETKTNLKKIDKNHLIPNESHRNPVSSVPSTPTPANPCPASPHNDDNGNRPTLAVANFSQSSRLNAAKTFEEQVGLPPRPKKPLTPYFRFMREMRPKLIVENPKASTTDLVRILSKRWEKAESSLKERLQEEYKREQQKYVETRAKYDAKISDKQREEIKQLKQDVVEAKERRMMRKRIRELGRPKRPSSAFLLFLVKERTANPQQPKQTYREWQAKCSEKWTRLPESEKEPFTQQARSELEKYKKDLNVWEEKMIRAGNIDVVRHSNLIDPPEPKPKKQQQSTSSQA